MAVPDDPVILSAHRADKARWYLDREIARECEESL